MELRYQMLWILLLFGTSKRKTEAEITHAMPGKLRLQNTLMLNFMQEEEERLLDTLSTVSTIFIPT